jgi:4-amino-4-deoxy-L-arabinose transferase-like glycosyltransferase
LQNPRWHNVIPSLLTLLLVLAWLLPGLVGHDPWKGDESRSIGFVHSELSGEPAVIPSLAGMPLPVHPPLFTWVAASAAQGLSDWLPVHDAIRLTAGMFVLLALIFTGLTSRLLYGSEHGRLAVLILIGSVGLLVRAHEAIPQSALLAAYALTGFGFALNLRRPLIGGAVAGTGIGLAFMSIGTLEALALVLTALLLPVMAPAWRKRINLAAGLVLVVSALPWLLIWPWLLYQQAPTVFHVWWHVDTLGRLAPLTVHGGMGTLYYLTFLPWFAWPAWPLALWALWKARRHGLTEPGIALPLLIFLSLLAVLSLTNDPREVHGLPLLLPLAWLAAGSTYTLRRGAANALYWFAMMTFLVVIAAAWVYWGAFDVGIPARLAAHVHKIQPGYAGEFRPLMVALALAYCFAWITLLLLLKRTPQRPLIAWAAGITLAWGLAASLFMYPVNARMSYRSMISSMEPALPSHGCVASRNLNEAMRAMLDYWIDLRTLPVNSARQSHCPALLVEYDENSPPDLNADWHKVWEGNRPGNRSERFALYQRVRVKH